MWYHFEKVYRHLNRFLIENDIASDIKNRSLLRTPAATTAPCDTPAAQRNDRPQDNTPVLRAVMAGDVAAPSASMRGGSFPMDMGGRPASAPDEMATNFDDRYPSLG